MNADNFIITGFCNVFFAVDKKSQRLFFDSRYASCFIVTVKGKISFTSESGAVIADKYSPVFIPEGLKYVNECLEDAESYVFNFHLSEHYDKPSVLSHVPLSVVKDCFSAIERAELSSLNNKSCLIMKELYSLADRLFFEDKKPSEAEKIIMTATEFMSENYMNPGFTIEDAAKKCYISEIYLRKLFAKHLDTTPFKALTDIRMNKAYILAREKRPVKEIALSVGYSDVYQFSRAYKKYFGYSPSDT